jgi:hypothetical protein
VSKKTSFQTVDMKASIYLNKAVLLQYMNKTVQQNIVANLHFRKFFYSFTFAIKFVCLLII